MIMNILFSFSFFVAVGDTNKTTIDTTNNYILAEYIDELNATVYQDLLDSLTAYGDTDFFYLRMAFTKTKNYSPYSVFESKMMDSVKKYTEMKKYDRSQTFINKILEINFCYIPAHFHAAFIYTQNGDSVRSEFHKRIYHRLLESIETYGNGASPNHAFWVISTGEEYAYLRWNGWYSSGQSLITEDGQSFDLMKVKDKQTDREFDVYFNVSLLFKKRNQIFKTKESNK